MVLEWAMLRNIVLPLLLSLLPTRAHALTTSPQALRIEDSKEGNVVLGAEQASLEHGEFRKTILLLWGRLDIFGEVDEVVVLSGHVIFHDGSKLNKSLTVMGGSFESEPGSQVAAENVIAKVPGPAWRLALTLGKAWRDNFGWVAKLSAGIVSGLLIWLSGWALFWGFPGLQTVTEGALAPNWAKNLLLGILGSAAACAICVMLVVSIVGIVILPFYLLVLACAATVSYSAAALWAGHRFLPAKPGRRINPSGFLLGCLALQFFWAVPVWWALLPVALLWTLAWGALIRSSSRLWR